MAGKIKVGILGATGYAGVELVKILKHHPLVSISFVSSQSYAGQRLSDVFPELKSICDDVLLAPEKTADKNPDCVFSCLPHATSAALLLPFIKKGIRVIDLSADFRIRDVHEYEKWYKTSHPCPELLKNAVFGLCEHYRTDIAKAGIVANPGCYSSSIMLPLLPLFKDRGTTISLVIADSKSGVSGAGRSLKLSAIRGSPRGFFRLFHGPHAPAHRGNRTGICKGRGKPVTITFSPHLLPTNRGILSTMYLTTNRTAGQCLDIVKKSFMRASRSSGCRKPRSSEHQRRRTHKFLRHDVHRRNRRTSRDSGRNLDNLVKGASGQAVQNMNIMFGFEETTALL